MNSSLLGSVLAGIMIAGSVSAGTPVIGTVIADGAFRLNGETITSNGTLTEGAVLETGGGNSRVRLSGGARLALSPDSRGRFYGDRIVLEKGETRVENAPGFHLEALGLTIRPDRGTSVGRIGLLSSNRVRVAAQAGSFRVFNARGMLVANVLAGATLAFEPQANAPTQVTGVLTENNGHFLLQDQVTHVTVEITGPNLRAQVGRVVRVTGTLNPSATPAAGATQVIAASSVQTVAAGAGAGAGAGGGAVPAGAGGAGAGIGVTTIAVIGGVATAATLGGLAAAGALPGQGSESR